MATDPSSQISTPSPPGATVTTVYLEREVKAYAVQEHELETLSMMNTLASVFFATSAFLLSAAISVWINALFYEAMPPKAEVANKYAAPIVFFLGGIFLSLGVWANRKRASTWNVIKGQTKNG
jgi:polyferredoxin